MQALKPRYNGARHSPFSPLSRADRDLAGVLRIEIDERDEGPAVVGADRAGLRDRRHVPSIRQKNRIAQPVQHALDHQVAVLQAVCAIPDGAGDLQLRALFAVYDWNIE